MNGRRAAPPVRSAVVVGAGIAGLAAASVLASRVGRVHLVERDRLPAAPQDRAGTPQARHLHNLLMRGQHGLESLFPGFGAMLAAGGAVSMDLTAEMRFHTIWSACFPRYPSDLHARVSSRALVEHAARRLLRGRPQVRWHEGHRVVGWLGDAGRLRGVRCEHDGATVDIEADLVVDASGRGSTLPRWLHEQGGIAVPVTEVDPGLGYASRIYRMPDAAPDWKMLVVRNPLPSRRGGGVLPLEGGRWIVTLAGFCGDHPPHDVVGFDAYARSFSVPDLADAMAAAEPLGPPVGYRRTTSLWRHYERLPHWPQGLLALGDGVCCFNPVYGQGMSVAASAAELLATLADRDGLDAQLGDRYRRALPAVLQAPWTMAASEDARYGAAGTRAPAGMRLRHRLMDAIAFGALRDPRIHYRWMRVAHLLDPPAALVAPAMLVRTAGAHLRRQAS
ncbi:MAG: FAD-dependent monooxygenase [Rubrivivax sp.]|nr:FAD-dependent monooxygenase [Rubrivivax sp.]